MVLETSSVCHQPSGGRVHSERWTTCFLHTNGSCLFFFSFCAHCSKEEDKTKAARNMADTKLFLCLVSLWFFNFTIPSLSCDCFVDVHIGNDMNDGASPSSPLLTLHEASKRVVTGKTKHNRICLSEGVYQEPQFLFKPFNASDGGKEIIVEGPALCLPLLTTVADRSCAFLQSLEATVPTHSFHLALKSLWIRQLSVKASSQEETEKKRLITMDNVFVGKMTWEIDTELERREVRLLPYHNAAVEQPEPQHKEASQDNDRKMVVIVVCSGVAFTALLFTLVSVGICVLVKLQKRKSYQALENV
ncbi:hypothetical protein QOT17_000929 [Balamuthia mandrillaris]